MQSVAREAWTDERLDDLTHRVDEGFNRTEREFQAVRLEMRTEFAAIRSEMKADSASLRSDLGGQIAALNRTLLQIAGGGFITFVAGCLGVVATQL